MKRRSMRALKTGMPLFVKRFPIGNGDVLLPYPDETCSQRLRITRYVNGVVDTRPWRWFDYFIPAGLYRRIKRA